MRKILLLLIGLFPLAALAQDTRGVALLKETKPVVKGETYAIIVGVSNYPGLKPLKYADKDALLFRDFLYTPAGGNVKKENVFALINDSAKAANFNVKAYSWLKRKGLKEGDRLFLYFSGHGDAMNEDNYFFLPFDCTPYNVDNNYLGTGNINMHTVKTLFVKPLAAKGVDVMLIIDACRTNELPGGESGQQSFSNYIQSNVTEQKQGEIIMLSTGAGSVSIESSKIGNGHGLFTWYLIDGLSGMADKEGDAADHDGVVSLAEISSWVKNRVRKDAREIFKTEQNPVFLPVEKENEAIAVVDDKTYLSWVAAKNLPGKENLYAFETGKKVKNTGEKAVTGQVADTILIKIYNKFVDAVKAGNLSGKQSGEEYYTRMAKGWPGDALTDDAKYTLATEFINFGQQKINLFLSGKSLIHLQRMEEKLRSKPDALKQEAGKTDKDSVMFSAVGEEFRKMRVIAKARFDTAAFMMQKAVEMLKNEPELLTPVYPKLYFLKAAALNNSFATARLKEGVAYCKMAIAVDSASAYNYLMLAWLMSSLHLDSSEYYYKKAITLAPKWAYPVNGLGVYYADRNKPDMAITFYKKAIALDSLYASAYQNIGAVFHDGSQPDSARYYYKKAIRIDPNNPYAYTNLGRLYRDSMSVDSGYFITSKLYFKKSIELNPWYPDAYWELGNLYLLKNAPDSAKNVLESGLLNNPANPKILISLGDFYKDNNYDTVNAERYYQKAIEADPYNLKSYYTLAGFYSSINANQQALATYLKAVNIDPQDPEVYNNLGNFYWDTFYSPSSDTIARKYYLKAIRINPDLAYVNYNAGRTFLGKNYTAKYSPEHSIPDSAIYYFEKAARDPSYLYLNKTIADLYRNKSAYDKAVYYYEKYLTSTFSEEVVEKITEILILQGKLDEAEVKIKKYAFKEFSNKLMGFVYAARGQEKAASLNFVQSLGFSEEAARAYLNTNGFPAVLHGRFPDRDGLIADLYYKYINSDPAQIAPGYLKNFQCDSNYQVPYFKVLSLFDADTYVNMVNSKLNKSDLNIYNIKNDKYFGKIKSLARQAKNYNPSYLAMVISKIDIYKSQRKTYDKNKIDYKFNNVFPAAFRYGVQVVITGTNKDELLDSLKSVLKKDSLNTRLHVAIADISLQIARNNVDNLRSLTLRNDAGLKKSDSVVKANFKQAAEHYQKAMQLNSKFNVVAYCRLGDFYLLSSQPDLAIKCYNRSVKDDPNFVYPYVKLAEYYNMEGNNQDSALYYLKKAAALDSLFRIVLNANLYEAAGYPKTSEAFLKQAAKDGFSQANWHLFKYYNKWGDRQNSLVYLEKRLAQFEEIGELYDIINCLKKIEEDNIYAELRKQPGYLAIREKYKFISLNNGLQIR